MRTRVSAALSAFLDRQEAEVLRLISPDLVEPAEALRSFLDGGKRMRPAFCYWGWRAAGGARADEALEQAALVAAASLELLQASALIHDDYMDGSDTRRGKPAVHRRFEALHRVGGWEGSPERFGAAAAILLGDITLTWCDEMFTRSGFDAARIHAARPVFDLMRSEVMAGQYLDVLAQSRGLSVASPAEILERAETVIRFKSAKYTIERPLQLGAALATGDAAETGALSVALSEYGLPLGEAFQLRDDVLGVFGDPAATGKPAGDDLREGKQTVLVALAAARADEVRLKLLREGLGDPDLDAAGVAALQEVIVDTGALESVEERIAQRTRRALEALDGAPVTDEAREVLGELAIAATSRLG
ncbi:polyprenyl synthetase family protein [Actinospica durhamensis]|uniref:Polyprenyl synthetase family protein n=1 Tax=Actinospica durhamensis TaxID=1508375 RepID=A0A941F0S0_9ACTN|nr:polyprenyl synthetase family protein [Actinospica durhamensis]MBR7839544.1 polyprenyl synthetase family protein [Actinospica durhamensis]